MSRAIDFMYKEGQMIWARLNSPSVIDDIKRRRFYSGAIYGCGIFASISIAMFAQNLTVSAMNNDASSADKLISYQFGTDRFEQAGPILLYHNDRADLTKSGDVKGYVDAQLKSLSKGGSVDCDAITSIVDHGWEDKNGGYSMPACVKFAGGNNIKEHTLVFSYINAGDESREKILRFVGLFHKEKNKWSFKNVSLSMQKSFEVHGYKTVPIYKLRDTIINDFPELYPKSEVERAKGNVIED